MEELGRGAMGIVYKARQLSLGREVAIKMILMGDLASGEERDRFRREAEIIAQLRHPNVVQIHEQGQQGAWPYFVMEFVPGGTLSDYLRHHWPDPRAAAQLVSQLALGLQHAHGQGVIHRDLKPSNILLQAFPEKRRESLADRIPRIADFGLAKWQRADAASSGHLLGTPQYLAPEQAADARDQIGPATDIHALGVILYEMLTGQSPFRGDSLLDLLRAIVHEAPKPPRKSRPSVPVALERICLKCLEKSPARRYPSGASLAADLNAFLMGRPLLLAADPESALSRWPLLAWSAATVLILVAAVVLSAWKGTQQESVRPSSLTATMALQEQYRRRALTLTSEDPAHQRTQGQGLLLRADPNRCGLILTSASAVVPAFRTPARMKQLLAKDFTPDALQLKVTAQASGQPFALPVLVGALHREMDVALLCVDNVGTLPTLALTPKASLRVGDAVVLGTEGGQAGGFIEAAPLGGVSATCKPSPTATTTFLFSSPHGGLLAMQGPRPPSPDPFHGPAVFEDIIQPLRDGKIAGWHWHAQARPKVMELLAGPWPITKNQ